MNFACCNQNYSFTLFLFSFLPLNNSKIPLTNDSTKLNHKAVQKPSTLNPSTNLSANKMINAFITSKNKPRVKKVIGNDRIVKIGLTMVFKNANTMATKTAVVNLFNSGGPL